MLSDIFYFQKFCLGIIFKLSTDFELYYCLTITIAYDLLVTVVWNYVFQSYSVICLINIIVMISYDNNLQSQKN